MDDEDMRAQESGMGFHKIGMGKRDDDMEMISINFDADNSDNYAGDVIILRNRPRDAFYYFHDQWRLHPRLCGAFLAILFICVPISIAFGVLMSEPPEIDYRWVSYPLWVEANADYAYMGMVAADDARCSDMGSQILQQGGNAVDAAVTAALCLGVVSPGSSGLGGGSFLLFYNSTSKESNFFDGRETAPAAAHQNMFVNDPSLSSGGGMAIAVPGQIHALYDAWKQHGKMDWYDIVIPVAELAGRFQVSSTLAGHIKNIEQLLLNRNYHQLRKYLSGRYNRLVKAGEFLQNPQLKQTLIYIASDGPSHLYTSPECGARLAKEIQAAGGIITDEDLQSYKAVQRQVVKTDVLGFSYHGAPPPSSGGLTLATILKFMDGYSVPLVAQGDLYYHRLVEAFKHAFGLRMALGDPDFVNLTEVSETMLNGDYIAALRNSGSDSGVNADLSSYGGAEATGNEHGRRMVADQGTSHLSVVDRWGNSVAITSTVNTYFGSKIYSPSCGIVLNNQMDDFSSPNTTNAYNLAPFETNYIMPGKRPLSSMSPFVLADQASGNVRLVGGASGGPVIITSVAQVILNVIGKGMSVLNGVIEPRIHSQLYPDEVTYESISGLDAWGVNGNGLIGPVLAGGDGGHTHGEEIKNTKGYSIRARQSTLESLTNRGHVLRDTGILGVTQFIEVNPDTGEMLGISDPRKNGKAFGVHAEGTAALGGKEDNEQISATINSE